MPVLLFVVALLSLAGCSQKEPLPRIADYRTAGELRVATRLDAISYRQTGDEPPSGFEHDLLEKLAQRLEVPVRFVVYPDAARALDAVLNGEVHIAAAGLARNDRFPLRWSAPLREVDYVLVGRADASEIDDERELAGRRVAMRRGSPPADALDSIRKRVPGLDLDFPARHGEQALLEQLARGERDLVATDRVHFALAAQTRPELAVAYELPTHFEIAWAVALDAEPLARDIDAFLTEARDTQLLARVADRYFGHIRRLDDNDIATFLAHLRSRLPRFREHFHEAQARTGIDWRLLAALAYQESQWDPLATSRTGVRGMMMLTSETADRLGIADRLDARDSILGGSRYFSMLREQLPDEVPEPDRTWIAAAAYNLGMGHMNGARAIARGMGKDDRNWWDMKAVLPLLSRPEYAARLKAGAARGGEAVIMTENIRNYHGILTRLEPPYSPPLQPAGLKNVRAAGTRLPSSHASAAAGPASTAGLQPRDVGTPASLQRRDAATAMRLKSFEPAPAQAATTLDTPGPGSAASAQSAPSGRDEDMPAMRQPRGSSTSTPPIHGTSACGTTTDPSAC